LNRENFHLNYWKILINKGYYPSEKTLPVIGKVDAIMVLSDGKLERGDDKRGDDKASGF
jgi:gamma-glutamyltranspeptidase/glutathione hydrolase